MSNPIAGGSDGVGVLVWASPATAATEIEPVTPLTIDVTDHGRARLVAVGGELDLTTSPALQARLIGELDAGRDVELDLSAVGFVDSSALRTLVLVDRRARELGVRFELLPALPAQVHRVLEVTGLLARLPIAPAARAAPQASAPTQAPDRPSAR